ncbi:hypothetical protein GSB9_01517 [Flavobacteriaceae bacterium GSB9]|nr:hypothetical protein GSB9_01517 [Flavobacteriaceae bacterium GSB9]
MKKLALVVFIFSNVIFAQNQKTPTVNDSEDASFEVVEEVPVYKGCNKKLVNAILKKCMSDKISEHIAKHFNINIAYNLGLPDGLVKINVFFKVDTQGNITKIKAKGGHRALEKEARRVIALIPKLTRPGYHRGKPVVVPYAIPIMLGIDNSEKDLERKK